MALSLKDRYKIMNPRDALEAACDCKCHACSYCSLIGCPGIRDVVSCSSYVVAQEEMAHDVSAEEGFSF